MGNKIDLTGLVFGSLTVIKEDGRTKDGKVKWLCQCECGSLHSANGRHLRQKRIKSCGCRQYVHSVIHGKSKTNTYKIWRSMKSRCLNPSNSRYKDYGGRGIRVCDRWLHSFENFLSDMGERPNGHSIDRINVNGDYEPSNCKWSTPKEQGNNRRTNVLIAWQGKTQNIRQWAEETGISDSMIRHRLNAEMSIDKVFEPVRKYVQIEYGGKSQTLTEWAREIGITQGTLWGRLHERGWTVEEALSTPQVPPATKRSLLKRRRS